MTILRNDPVRNAFSSHSTGNNRGRYYGTKGEAICAFSDALKVYNLFFDHPHLTDWSEDSGRETLEVLDDKLEVVGLAIIFWYRTETGRYEFVGYLA